MSSVSELAWLNTKRRKINKVNHYDFLNIDCQRLTTYYFILITSLMSFIKKKYLSDMYPIGIFFANKLFLL